MSDTKVEDIRKKLGSQIETLYVGNLPYHYETQDVLNLIKDCGAVTKVEAKKGFAFV